MDSIILHSKISHPRTPPSFVERPHLEKKLTESTERVPSLSLIIAPPGYGKTFLTASWASGIAHSAWVTIGKNDNIFISFVRYLISGIKLSFPGFGDLISEIFSTPINRTPEYIAEIFAYEIEKIEQTLSLVIDNYQEISDTNITVFMTGLLDNMPHNLHLVILSQEDPPFSVSERRLSENILEIRQKDLKFSIEEINKIFINSFSITLPEEYLRKIATKTEGWPAAVSLSALSLSKIEPEDQLSAIDTSLNSYNYIIDYFADAVIANIDQTILDFIIDTVLLESFNRALADYSCERIDSESIIMFLKQKHLPILIQENDHEWLRYHTLFSEYIKSKFKSPNQLSIYSRASKWFEINGGLNSAIRYAILSGDSTRTESLLNKESESLFLSGKFEIISNLFKTLHPKAINSPAIIKVKLWTDYLTNNYENPEIFIEYIDAALEEPHAQSGELLCLKAWVLFDMKNPSSEETASKSRKNLKTENTFYSFMAKLIYGKSLLLNGKPLKAIEILSATEIDMKESNYSFIFYAVMNNLINAYCASGNIDEALRTGKKVLYQSSSDEIFKPEKSMILAAMARVYIEKKKLKKAKEYAETAFQSNHLINMNNLIFEDIPSLIKEIDNAEEPDKAPEIVDSSAELLSRREKEVVKLVSEGHSNQEISSLLFISIGTVKWHLNNIFGKLNTKNRTQLILTAEKLKLL